MQLDMETLCSEIEHELASAGIAVFRSYSRFGDDRFAIEWDTRNFPDFREFIKVASALGVRVMVFHVNRLSASLLDSVEEDLAMADLPPEDERERTRFLNSLREREGSISEIELSFDLDQTTYLYAQQATWMNDLREIMDELSDFGDDEDDDEPPMGGFYSRN